MGIVPAADLDRTFKFTFRTHTSNFPISAYDLRNGYEQMLEAERLKREREHRDFMTKMEADRRLTQFHECECYNTGFRRVPDPKGGPHMGVVRCDRCRPEHRSSFYTA